MPVAGSCLGVANSFGTAGELALTLANGILRLRDALPAPMKGSPNVMLAGMSGAALPEAAHGIAAPLETSAALRCWLLMALLLR